MMGILLVVGGVLLGLITSLLIIRHINRNSSPFK